MFRCMKSAKGESENLRRLTWQKLASTYCKHNVLKLSPKTLMIMRGSNPMQTCFWMTGNLNSPKSEEMCKNIMARKT